MRVCVQEPLRGVRFFSGKVFATQMRHRTRLFISKAIMFVYAPIQKNRTTGCRVNVISYFVLFLAHWGLSLCNDKSYVYILVVNLCSDQINSKT